MCLCRERLLPLSLFLLLLLYQVSVVTHTQPLEPYIGGPKRCELGPCLCRGTVGAGVPAGMVLSVRGVVGEKIGRNFPPGEILLCTPGPADPWFSGNRVERKKTGNTAKESLGACIAHRRPWTGPRSVLQPAKVGVASRHRPQSDGLERGGAAFVKTRSPSRQGFTSVPYAKRCDSTRGSNCWDRDFVGLNSPCFVARGGRATAPVPTRIGSISNAGYSVTSVISPTSENTSSDTSSDTSSTRS